MFGIVTTQTCILSVVMFYLTIGGHSPLFSLPCLYKYQIHSTVNHFASLHVCGKMKNIVVSVIAGLLCLLCAVNGVENKPTEYKRSGSCSVRYNI